MADKLVREIIKAFSKLGLVEYRMMEGHVDICKDGKIIGRVKDNCLYLIDKEAKFIRAAHSSKDLRSDSSNKMIVTCNLSGGVSS